MPFYEKCAFKMHKVSLPYKIQKNLGFLWAVVADLVRESYLIDALTMLKVKGLPFLF